MPNQVFDAFQESRLGQNTESQLGHRQGNDRQQKDGRDVVIVKFIQGFEPFVWTSQAEQFNRYLRNEIFCDYVNLDPWLNPTGPRVTIIPSGLLSVHWKTGVPTISGFPLDVVISNGQITGTTGTQNNIWWRNFGRWYPYNYPYFCAEFLSNSTNQEIWSPHGYTFNDSKGVYKQTLSQENTTEPNLELCYSVIEDGINWDVVPWNQNRYVSFNEAWIPYNTDITTIDLSGFDGNPTGLYSLNEAGSGLESSWSIGLADVNTYQKRASVAVKVGQFRIQGDYIIVAGPTRLDGTWEPQYLVTQSSAIWPNPVEIPAPQEKTLYSQNHNGWANRVFFGIPWEQFRLIYHI